VCGASIHSFIFRSKKVRANAKITPPNETCSELRMRTKFWQNYFLGKGFAKTSAHLFLNSEVANGKGGV